MAQVQILTGPERRRFWSDDQKRAIVAAVFAPGAVVSHVARQLDISTGLIYRWRQEQRAEAPGFAEVVVSPSPAPTGAPSSTIDILLGDGARVQIPATASPELAAAVLTSLVRR